MNVPEVFCKEKLFHVNSWVISKSMPRDLKTFILRKRKCSGLKEFSDYCITFTNVLLWFSIMFSY